MSDRLRLPNSRQLYFSGGTAGKKNFIEALNGILFPIRNSGERSLALSLSDV